MNCEWFCVCGLTIFLFITLFAAERSPASNVPLSLPGCNKTCGDIPIPYPFGMGPGCFKDDWYEIVCVSSSTPFLHKAQLEVLSISLPETEDSGGSMLVKSPVASSGCQGKQPAKPLNLSGSNFFLSRDHNLFIAVGCNTNAFMTGIYPQTIGCSSTCDPHNYNNEVQNGLIFCYISIPSYLQVFQAHISPMRYDNKSFEKDCQLAFAADYDSIFREEIVYRDTISDTLKLRDLKRLEEKSHVPLRLAWYVSAHECPTENGKTISRLDGFGGEYSSCGCADGYTGNPFITRGCQDVDECAVTIILSNANLTTCGPDYNCVNTPGSYYCEKKKTSMIALGVGIGVSVSILALVIWRLLKCIQNKKIRNRRRKIFQHNRRLYLEQQLAIAAEGEAEPQIRIFTLKELEKATDKFNENRVLGHGGQGTVYKGMLEDGRVVAIKRAREFDRENVRVFINEAVVLSQINHRNIVKLFGCCLETHVPMLVYELVPNGNLYQNLHSQKFPLTWEIRFRIAREVAGAIFYLHSFTNVPVYHRDIKSTNILMDGNYRAKLSDFGISRSVSIDKTHLTTRVQGTFGYFDPEYYILSKLTEKSDVYSFGVVLVELLTGERPISRDSENQFVSLSMRFTDSMEENRVLEILDQRLKGRCNEEEVVSVANIARKCLNMKQASRPTMREVAIELDRIRPAQSGSQFWNDNDQEIEEFAISFPDCGQARCSFSPSLDEDPLLMHRLRPFHSTSRFNI